MSEIKVGSKVKIIRPQWEGSRDAVVLGLPYYGYGFYKLEYQYHGKTAQGGFLPENVELVSQPVTPGYTPRYIARVAKQVAVKLGREQKYVTSDHVQNELARTYGKQVLGNAAGTLFKGNFIRTGQTVKSVRPEARGRRISVWQYIGQ